MKEEIISRLEALVKEEISEETFQKAEEIKNEFLLACQQAEHALHESMLSDNHSDETVPKKDPLDGRFNELLHILDDRERKFKKLRREEIEARLEAKKAIID